MRRNAYADSTVDAIGKRLPRDGTDVMRVMSAWDWDQPHGRYGLQDIIFRGSCIAEYRAVDEATELMHCCEHCDSLPKYAKRLHNGSGESSVDWRTFDSYVKGR